MGERSRAEIGAFLRQGTWFGGLEPELQELILRRSRVLTYGKGQLLQMEEGEAVGLFAVLDGRVLLMRYVNSDRPVLVHVAGPGWWFGEMSLFSPAPMATAVAQGPLTALVFPRASFLGVVAAEPRHYAAFAQLAFSRYRVLLRYYSEARGLSLDDRLRLRLADLAELRRLDVAIEGKAVTLEMSQAELAVLVGLSRQKLNSRLRDLQAQGWIEVGPRRIVVRDAEGLRAATLGI
jgi:CRP-like cAMP-binding protein